VWHPWPEWLAGDMFDAFMNYPLAEAIIGFAAQHQLDLDIELPEEYVGQLTALDEPHMRALILDVAEHWIRFGIDGWRLDVAEEVGADFWREFRQRVRAADPEAYLVAEVWHPWPEWLAGDMFDAFMNYPLATAILGFAAQSHLETSIELPEEYEGQLRILDGQALWDRIAELSALYDPAVTAVQLNLLGSHDTPRLRTLCGGDLDAVRLATLLQMTLPGAPCIYFGDEIGMVGGMDPGCRAAFPVEAARWDDEPAGWFGDLARLRHSSRALRDGELRFLHAEGAALAYLRRADADAFVCLLNAGESELAWVLPIPDDVRSGQVSPLRSAREETCSAEVGEGQLHAVVPARHGMVVRLDVA
jgi:neopullulanase